MDLQYHVYDDQNFLTSTWAIINPRPMSIAPYGMLITNIGAKGCKQIS